MPRSTWSGIISFGLVNIPVSLYKATEEKSVSFNLLHAKCRNKINEKRWCAECNTEVGWEDLVKGYQYAKNEFVILDEADFKNLPLPSKDVIEVSSFTKIGEIDASYFDKCYCIQPDKVAAKAYQLLFQALKEKGVVAVGTIALRTKEHLCVLRPYNNVIVLNTLYYPDELRISEFDRTPTVTPTKQELKLAETLIDQMTAKFEPDKYKDHYRIALEEVIESKLEGQEAVVQLPSKRTANVVDLMASLEASLKKASASSAAAKKEEPPREKTSAPKTKKSDKVAAASTRKARTG